MLKQLFIMLLLLPMFVSATKLSVNKPRILLVPKHNKEEFRIYNPTDEFQTYRVSLIDMQMDENGSIQETTSFEQSAKQFLRIGPRIGKNIAPDQFQSFRVMLKRKGLVHGEFRSHILLEALLPPIENPKEGVTVRPNIRYSVPVFVRQGDLPATVSLSDISLKKNEEDKTMLHFTLHRQGERSIYGDIEVYAPDQPEPIFSSRGLAIYTEINQRHFQYPIDNEIPSSGDLMLKFYENPDFGGNEQTEATYPLEHFHVQKLSLSTATE